MSITRERLKELINNRQPLWSFAYYMDGTKDVCIFNPKAYHIDNDNDMMRYNYGDELYIKFEDLFETEEDAKFALRYKRIPHTEYLNLPTWEEIQKVKFYEFFVNEYDYMLQYQPVSKKIALYDRNNKGDYFLEDATEENYYKALDMCVNLWEGE